MKSWGTSGGQGGEGGEGEALSPLQASAGEVSQAGLKRLSGS